MTLDDILDQVLMDMPCWLPQTEAALVRAGCRMCSLTDIDF
jgi:hypothetical protein